jgi:hypothetical protein
MMSQSFYRTIFFLTILQVISSSAVTPYFRIRSQSEDAARELVGWTQQINLADIGYVYGSFSVTPEYTRSFWSGRMADCLLGIDYRCDNSCGGCGVKGNGELVISGSRVANRGAHDWLADYFGLPTDYKSTVTIAPRISTILFDLNFYLGLDEWCDGLYLRIHTPIVHTSWDLNFCENIINAGINSQLPGYFNESTTGIDRAQLVNSFTDYVSAQAVPNLGAIVSFEALKNSKMATRAKNKSALSDIQVAFGWNFLLCDDYHFGVNIRGAAPTGNRPCSEFLFEPMVGNSHHWELGIGLTSHYTLWRSCDDLMSAGIYADCNITHLFRAHQRRSFDLKGRPNSRYMLAQKLGTPVANLFVNPLPDDQANSAIPAAQFQNVFTPVANLTTFDVDSRIAAQIDLAILADFATPHWNLDIGYNVWAQTCESLRLSCRCPAPLDGNVTWVLKGDSFVYGFAQTAIAPITFHEPIALSPSESQATLNHGTNNFVGPDVSMGGIDGIQPTRNPGVDSAQFARFLDDATAGANIIDLVSGSQTKTSKFPIFIRTSDLDLNSARTKGLSHKVFAHVSYIGDEYCGWIPYIGVGGKAEFFSTRALSCQSSCNTCECQRCGVSEWGVWIKGGVSYN